jgi:aldose sugar dehydrogenase
MFVGDFNNGNIYHFDLNKERTKLILNGTLEDTIVDTSEHNFCTRIWWDN